MSKIKLRLIRTHLVLIFLSLYFSNFAKADSYIGAYSVSEIESRIEALSNNVDFKVTKEVHQYLKQYLVTYRYSSEQLIGRSLYYFPQIEQMISDKNLPDEIKYLAIIESSLKPSARSGVGAVGLWQFMRPTGRMYGLHIGNEVDERKDPEKSTDAALRYLSDLNDRFGDWTLALAAYNCGPGNVSKAMRRSGGKDYWSIRNYLPKETRNYLPKFIAMAYLMNHYQDHELTPNYPEQLFTSTRVVKLTDKTSFADICDATGLDIKTVKFYNQQFNVNYIPKSKDGYTVKLPSSAMHEYLLSIGAIETYELDPILDLEMETLITDQEEEIRDLIKIDHLGPLDNAIASFKYESKKEAADLGLKLVPTANYDAGSEVRKGFYFRRKDQGRTQKKKSSSSYRTEVVFRMGDR